MFTVRLCNFRKWRERQITIPTTGITLLKGKSGAGKSTILNAIFWCLYGTLRKVGPLGDEKLATEVQLDFHTGITITRQTKPQQLKIFLQGQYYEGEVAQSLIDKWFGNDDVWQMSCYIAQGQRNSFLAGTNATRMEILNLITFHEEDPSVKIERLASILKDKQNERKQWEEQFHTLSKNFEYATQQSGIKEIDFTLMMDIRARQQLLQKKEQLHKQIHHASAENKRRQQLLLEINDYRTKLETLVAPREPTTLSFNQTSEQLNGLLHDFASQKKLQQEIVVVPDFLPFTVEDQSKARMGEIDYERQRTLAISCDVEYTSDAITAKIAELQRILDAQNLLIQWHRYSEIVQQIQPLQVDEQLSNAPREFTMDDLQKAIEQELQYRIHSTSAKELGVPYSKDAIAQQILIWTNDLKQQERRVLITQLRENLQHGEPISVEPVVPILNIELPSQKEQLQQLRTELDALNEELPRLRQSCDAVMCPQCNAALLYEKDRLLFLGSSDHIAQNQLLVQEKQSRLTEIKDLIVVLSKSIDRLSREEQQRNTDYQIACAKSKRDFAQEVLAYELILQERTRLQGLVSETEEIPFMNVTEIPRKLEKLQGILIVEAPQHSSSEIRATLASQEKRQKLMVLQEQLRAFPSDLVKPSCPLLNNTEKAQYQQKLATLNTIVIHSLPNPSSADIILHLQRQGQAEKQRTIMEKLHEVNERIGIQTLDSVQDQLRQLQQYDKEMQQYHSTKQRYILEHEFLTTHLHEKEKILAEIVIIDIEKLETEIIAINERVANSDKLTVLYEQYQQLNKVHQHLSQLIHYLSKAEELKQILIKCQCELLEETVLNFNNIVEDISRDLFEDDISISLELFKAVKSTGIVKPQVNFSIVYQGNSFDNINQLSGGEGDRISLALTLGFSKLNSFPLMFFDESLAFLDQEVKNNVVESLHKMHKGIVVVMHDGVEGIFDSVLEL